MSVTVLSRSRHCPDRTFRSYGELLRWLLDEHGREFSYSTGREPGLAELSLGTERGGFFHPRHVPFFPYVMDAAVFGAADRMLRRYQRYRVYLTEEFPQWRTVRRISWMDNSTDLVQRDQWGNERTVQETAPHGDLC